MCALVASGSATQRGWPAPRPSRRPQAKRSVTASTDKLTDKLDVSLPNLETSNARQNVQLLRALATESGGTYLQLDERTAVELPKLLPNHGEEFLVDERLRTLWDRDWVLYLLVGLLSAEWLTRKLLKLA